MFALLVTGCSGKKDQDRNTGKADFSFTSEQFYQENRDLEEAAILKKYAATFPDIKLFPITDIAKDWPDAHKQYIGDGGVFDSIYKPKGR